ncbi:AMP-dependent synthetase/ligase [Ornithinimicrobium tianjinense]|uniref:Acyl-CoA synthetase n=1 Tax=Ornithinimicrobium tianjinense TaxID=1195761 RepID=A0A917BIT2_9MICO|nr:AMP-dependent synthetase/ligase [Ornithinimicrobium tianjinense]GGF45204.1 long-chain-fatty-acid--CoA ligase [Ornithinimicrobium tianjinense]
MTETSVPPLVPSRTEGNIADYVVGWAEREPGRPMMAVRTADGWADVSAAELHERVVGLARGFVAAGIEAGDRVAIMSRTRMEWALADFALWMVGAVPVPVYETSSRSQVEHILRDSRAVAAIVEEQAQTALVSSLHDALPDLHDVWQIEAGALDELSAAGVDVDLALVEARRAAVSRSDLASIIYTSGTTGDPKGCELTHGNFMALAENTAERLPEIARAPGASTLLFLPLAHVFARLVQVLAVHAGLRVGHTPDPADLLEDLATYRPTFLLAVPRVFEKIYNGAESKAQAAGRGQVFRWAARVARDYSQALSDGGPGLALRAQHSIADRLVYARLRAAMGGRVTYAISGGAALGERLGHFFRGIGLVVLEGYGMTETTAPATVNTPDMIRIGTVGRPLPGVAVRVDDDGEVWVRGINVFRGYHGQAEATAQARQDGWLRTGDLGALDPEGFLTITGRTKELLVTAGGKNVSPGPLEDRLRAHPLVSQCIVVGDGRPFVGALVTLDTEMLPTWAAGRGRPGLTVSEAVTDEEVLAEVQRAVDEANAAVSRAESIRSFRLLAEDFTIDNGMLTPSMKLKRQRITDALQDEIERLYARA